MNFGISDNSCMFVTVSRPKKLIQIKSGGIFYAHLATYLSKDIRLFKSRSGYLICLDSFFGRKTREANSLSFINQISSLMTKEMNLNKGTNVASFSSTHPSEKGKSQSKLEKEIISIQKKVSKLQDECRHERNEKYRLLCYINRYCSALFPYFDKSNPVNSKNWERVHRLQLDLDKEIK